MSDRIIISEWKRRPKQSDRAIFRDSIHPGYQYNLSPGQKLVEVVDKEPGYSVTKHIVVGL